MKPIFKISVGILLVYLVFLLSCKKDIVTLGELNKPPIANAGNDQTIILPKDSVLLDGSASADPDGKIRVWLWTKISGPASFSIIHASDSVTVVKKLTAGTYQFELKVTDNGGLSAKDTLKVVVDSFFNHPPKANAGNDTILPSSSVTLDGSRSTDPDDNITSYGWTKISGPSSFNISNAGGIQTQAMNLVEGIYQFELKVTDAGGLFSKDTVEITVNAQMPACDNSNRPQITTQLIPLGSLSQSRVGMAVASAGNKILFAGGINNDLKSARVDIYDINTQTWSTAELSMARYGMAAVAAGNKIFFGGGEIGDGTEPVNTVDIYDVSTNTWSVTTLSAAGNNVAATTTGNKVFFAGGNPGFSGVSDYDRSSKVDIYDLVTGTWSTASLSEGKTALSAVATNNKVYFAGGGTRINNSSNKGINSILIDIYDNATNTWTTSFLQEGKSSFAGIAVGDKIYWAGGKTSRITGSSSTGVPNFSSYTSCVVEIRDVSTGSVTIQNLFKPADFSTSGCQKAVIKNNKIIFYGSYASDSDKFDIYDITTNTWSIGLLPMNIKGACILSVNNIIYVAGGYVNGVLSNQVYKLEF